MLLCHHTVPLTTSNLLIILEVQQRITFEGLTTALCPAVGLRIVLCGQLQIHGLGIVHLIDVAHGLNREKNDLSVGILVLGLQGDELAKGAGFQCLVFSDYL